MVSDVEMADDFEEKDDSSELLPQESCTFSESSTFLVKVPNSRTRYFGSLHLWSWLGQLVLFCMSIGILFLSRNGQGKCTQRLSMFSPALEAIDDNYRIQRINGSVLKDGPFRGPLSETLDEQWKDLFNFGAFSISHETLIKIGASEDSVQLPPESGGGYMAMLEVYHQIHCVHMLWQNTHPSYGNISEREEGPNSIPRRHIDHCADVLRQKLMCDADVGVITYNWVKHFSHPVPNFNTLHKCRNFNSVSAWMAENQAPVPFGGKVTRTKDVVDLEELP